MTQKYEISINFDQQSIWLDDTTRPTACCTIGSDTCISSHQLTNQIAFKTMAVVVGNVAQFLVMRFGVQSSLGFCILVLKTLKKVRLGRHFWP